MILIAGASGTIGHAIAREALTLGHKLRILALPDDPLRALEDMQGAVEVHRGSFDDLGNELALFDDVDTVINAAGYVVPLNAYRTRMTDINVHGTARFANAAKAHGIARFVHISSAAAVGYGDGAPIDESFVYNAGSDALDIAYADTKRQADVELAQIFPPEALIFINPAAVLSPWSHPRWGWTKLLGQVAARELPLCPPGGTGFLSARDVAGAVFQALGADVRGGPYLLVSENLTYRELFSRFGDICGARPPALRVPGPVLHGLGYACKAIQRVTRADEPPFLLSPETTRLAKRKAFYSAVKARSDFGFSPAPVVAALEETWAWMRTHLPELQGHTAHAGTLENLTVERRP